eukprot:COSAG02_NODE_165_length_32175_cov_86.109490_18_plen_42_part_00
MHTYTKSEELDAGSSHLSLQTNNDTEQKGRLPGVTHTCSKG